MAHWARWSDPNGAAPRCEHLDATRLVSPRSETCERCAATGLTPVALLICLTCGWVACSDLYVVTGLGVTVGFHRCFTHRSFTAAPLLRVTLAIAGSMSFQGSVIGWVATHRRQTAA
jgi:hypothetical protein